MSLHSTPSDRSLEGGKNLNPLFNAFTEYLCLRNGVDGIKYDAIMFSFGAHVRLDRADTFHHPFPENCFEDSKLISKVASDFPNYRVVPSVPTFEETLKNNKNDCVWSHNLLEPYRIVCSKDYGCLIYSEYPLPTGVKRLRILIPFSKDLFLCKFTALDQCCTSFILTHDEDGNLREQKDMDGEGTDRCMHVIYLDNL